MRRPSVFILLFLFAASFSWAKNCEENQGAMDFGSGTTKVLVATLDVCEKKIIKVIYEDRLPLALNEAFEKSQDQKIPWSVVEKELPRLHAMVKKVRDLQVTKISAVATSVFRVAKNGQETAQALSDQLGIPLQVIPQKKEAELGYWSAAAALNEQHPSFIVWDIGGGSMQMYQREGGQVFLYEGQMASVSFKNTLLEVLQFKNPQKESSPNPFWKNKAAALQVAKNHAYLHVPRHFKDRARKARWIGVGGVLSMSVQRQAAKDRRQFTQEDLAQALEVRSKLRDAEVESDYRATDVSNLALVLGYMQALGIQKVETVQASLGQGLLFFQLHH